jgi:DNA-binding beta-propeller fold protein YncE
MKGSLKDERVRLRRNLVGLAFLCGQNLAAAPPGDPPPSPVPLRLVADVPMPGPAVRFDYQSLDAASGRLYVSHMNADQLVVFDTRARKVVANLDGFARVRGVWAVPELRRVYAAARATHEVVVLDTDTLKVVARVGPVPDPDGIAYAPKSNRVFVSDEKSKADAVIDAKANDLVTSIALGGEAGNTVYDGGADRILVAVAEPAELVVIDPATARVSARVPLPGLKEPHGIALNAVHGLAFVAGQANHMLAVVDLQSREVLEMHPVGEDPDVLAFDPEPGLLYVAAESGTVSVFAQQGRKLVSRGQLTIPHAHSVCVDPGTHLVYLPLENLDGRPVLRIMEPSRER